MGEFTGRCRPLGTEFGITIYSNRPKFNMLEPTFSVVTLVGTSSTLIRI